MFSTSIHSLITGKSSACLDSAIPALPGKSVRIASAVRECKFYFTYRPASCLKYSVREHYAYVSKNVLVACFVQPRVSLNELYIPATCHEIFHPMTVTIKRILYIYNHNTTNSMLCGLMLRKLNIIVEFLEKGCNLQSVPKIIAWQYCKIVFISQLTVRHIT